MMSPPVPTAVAPTAFVPRAAPETALSTFLMTDIEGSTRLWEEHAAAMGSALAVHDGLLRAAIEASGGTIVKTTGDGMLAVFDDPVAAVGAAIDAQRTLRGAAWGATGPLRVRMATHSGAAESRDGDFFGPALNRTARLLAIGHGGQVLLSAVAAVLSRDRLPGDIELLDRGSHRLRDLDRPEQVFQVAVVDLPRDFPALRSLSTRRSNLPVQLTSFVGRERERAEVEALIGRARLVTLIGTGGTGKTRLLLEAAGEIAGRFADGAWLAELAPLGDPAQIAPEIARAVGAPELPGRPAFDTVAEFLADKELLLLLDNAEHLIDGVAEVAGRLLTVASGLRIMATSREALAVPGEAVVQVPSLSCPGGHDASRSALATLEIDLEEAARTEAVRLFAERAASVMPAFELTQGNVAAVSEICRRLDGIPLAIELAAARVSAMAPEDIARRLGDRFRLLAGGRRTAVPRQQTLHALIDWSWDLLNEDDRRLLRRLSIFTGGWTAEAAAKIVAGPAGTPAGEGRALDETADGLTRLVDRSLVIVDRGMTTRYRMLETIRQYAREKLIESGEASAIADRHFAYFATLAEVTAPALRGAALVDALDRLEAEMENLGSALDWGLEASPEAAISMCIAMLAYWRMRAASPEDEERILAAVAAARRIVAGPPPATKESLTRATRLLGDAATRWAFTGRGVTAYPWGEQALELARSLGDPETLVSALVGHAIASVFSGTRAEMPALRAMFEEIIRLATELGDWWTVAILAGGAAGGLASMDLPAAEAFLVTATDAGRRSGSPYAIAMTSMGYGRFMAITERPDLARAGLEEAIERFNEIGDVRFALASRSELAHAMRRADRREEAMALYRETFGGWIRLGNRGAVANQLENVAFLEIAGGSAERAARLLGAAEALREAAATPMAVIEEPEYAAQVARLRAGADGAGIDVAWAAGRSLSMIDAVAEAVGH